MMVTQETIEIGPGDAVPEYARPEYAIPETAVPEGTTLAETTAESEQAMAGAQSHGQGMDAILTEGQRSMSSFATTSAGISINR